MLNRRHLDAGPLHTDAVTVNHATSRQGAVQEDRTVYECGGRSLTAVNRRGVGETSIRRLLSSADDLEFFCSLPVETDTARIHAALDRALPLYLREKAEFAPELGAMMLDLGEPIGILYSRANLEEYAIWSVTHSDLVEQYLRRLQQRYLTIYRYCLDHDLADVYFLVGSELASPPLVSRATFQRWIVPFAAELIRLVHSYGRKVIQHYHGQIREILPDFLTMGADALHTIEAPPIGNCTLGDAFAVTRDRITLIGNIQYDDFRAFAPGQMRTAMQQLLAESAGHPFILSPTAGPYDPDPPDRLIANYHEFLDAAWEFGAR
jgi:hypothetical protein